MTAPAGEPEPLTAWRPGAVVVFGAGAALVVAAVVLRSSVPLFLALPLLMAPIAAGLHLPRRRITARLEWIERGTGEEVRVIGRIVTDPVVAPTSLYPDFAPPEPLVEVAPLTLEPDGDALLFALDYRAPFPCVLDFPLPSIVWRDPLGLAESSVRVVGAPLSVERFPPEVHRMGVVNLRRTTPLPGEIRSRAIGTSGEFYGIRPFTPSDTSRLINWRATARHGRLLANDYLLERTGDLVLILDLRPTSLGAARDARLLSISRAATLGIATAFLQQKSRVGVGVFGEFLEAVPLGTGRRHRYRIRRLLRAARVAPEVGPAERLAVSMRQYFPPGVLTLLLSPLPDDESILLLPHLRRRGYPTLVLSPSPLPLMTPTGSPRGVDDALAVRLLRLLRRRQFAQVWREAPAVDWEDYWSLSPLVHLLNRPVRPGGSL